MFTELVDIVQVITKQSIHVELFQYMDLFHHPSIVVHTLGIEVAVIVVIVLMSAVVV